MGNTVLEADEMSAEALVHKLCVEYTHNKACIGALTKGYKMGREDYCETLAAQRNLILKPEKMVSSQDAINATQMKVIEDLQRRLPLE